MELKALLQEMIDKKASDVFIVAGLPLTYTADGRQVRMDMAPLMPADTKELVDAIYELSGRNEQIFMDGHNHDDDFSFAVPGMGRFRVNVFRQRGSLGAVIRVIPFTLPNPADYHIPDLSLIHIYLCWSAWWEAPWPWWRAFCSYRPCASAASS